VSASPSPLGPVLWLTENYPPSRGGMAQSCDRIVDGLRNLDVTVDVAHLTQSVVPWSVIEQRGGARCTAPLADDPEHCLHRLYTVAAARHATTPYAAVVAFGGAYPIHAAPIYAAWLGVPLVVLLRGNDFDAGVFSLRRRSSLLDALRAADRLAVVARSMVDRVERLAPGTAVEWITNGIDVDTWAPLPSELDRSRRFRDAHVEAGRRTIGLLGQLKRKKGVLLLLDAIERSGTTDRFHLVLVGETEPEIDERLARAEPAAPTATVLPFLDRLELLAVLPACDVVALPSFYDGLPNVALEAAALGIPLLASDAGGLADLVDERVGFSFVAGDVDQCGEAVVELAKATDDDLQAKGEAARQQVRAEFGADREAAAYRRLLEDVTR
jgi:glycosyltransferase involved in cell wall biosynthesis